MSPASDLLASLFKSSETTGHANQSGNLSGNHLQVNVSAGLVSRQVVVQKAPEGLSVGASTLLAAGAAVVAGGVAAYLVKRQFEPPAEGNKGAEFERAGYESARRIAQGVMGSNGGSG